MKLKAWEFALLVALALETMVLVGSAAAHPLIDIFWWVWR